MPESLRRRRPRQSRVAAGAEDFAEFLRQRPTGGKLLLAATALALLWANLAHDSTATRGTPGTAIGPAWRCPSSSRSSARSVTRSASFSRLAFTDVAAQERSAAAVLVASVLASILAVVLLRRRTRAA